MTIAPPASTSPNWYCVRAQVKREHIAAANLHDRVSIEVFSPRIKGTYNTRRGLSLNATEALFPGYLFARFTYPDQFRHVMSTCGVTGIVAFGGRPPAVADTIIDHIRREVTQAERTPAAPTLEEGSWVRILSGCFAHIEGRILNFDPRTERVRLLLSLLGNEVQVSVAASRVAFLSSVQPLYPSGLVAARGNLSVPTRCAI